VLSAASELAERHDHIYVRALHEAMAGLAAYQRGEWRTALESAQRGERIFREQCMGVAQELATTLLYIVWDLFWLGDFREMSSRIRQALSDARARGDLYAEVSLSVGLPSFRGLMADDPKGTRGMIAEASERWSVHGYHLQHYWRELGLAQCELYEGEPEAVLERIEAQWPAMKKVFFHRIEAIRTEVVFLRGRCALAAAKRGDSKRLLASAARDATRMSREKNEWCHAAADLLRAGVRAIGGRQSDAVELLERAEKGFRETDTHAFAAAAQRCRGDLLGGDEGGALVAESVAWMKERDVRNPERMLDFFAPCFED